MITLNLAERLWWLSHCRYWSVWVVFLYTVMDRPPFSSGFTIVSQKGMEPSSLLSSTVNFMAGSALLMCWRKPCLLTSLWITKVSSTYLHQHIWGGVQCLGLFALSTPCKGLLLWDLLGNPWLHPQPVQRTGLGRRNRCFQTKIMSSIPMTVLSLRVGSFSNRSFIIFNAGSIGTDMKRADTSYELRHSPGTRVMCLTCSTKSWVLLI